jgi:hypothetical protein
MVAAEVLHRLLMLVLMYIAPMEVVVVALVALEIMVFTELLLPMEERQLLINGEGA